MGNREEFINKIGPIIQKAAFARGYNFPSAIIAQACKETGFCTDTLGKKYNNFFGMKCGSKWTGKSVNLKTKEEYKVGTLITIKDNFRAYDTIEQGVDGYFSFISAKRYQNLKNATSAEDYCAKIKEDGWATSSTYTKSLINDYINKYNLKRFDSKTSEKLPEKAEPKVENVEVNNGTIYTVKSGDTLGKIAEKYNTTINNIAKVNNIKNVNIINVGQKLVIPGSAEIVVPKVEIPKKINKLGIGQKVKLTEDAVQYGTNRKFASFVYKSVLYVRQINGNRIIVSTQERGAITGVVDLKYLKVL